MPQNIYSYSEQQFREEMSEVLDRVRPCQNKEAARHVLFNWVNHQQRKVTGGSPLSWNRKMSLVRDCARSLRSLLSVRSEKLCEASLAEAIFDVARNKPLVNFTPAFFAEITHLFRGMFLDFEPENFPVEEPPETLHGREAALARSSELDHLWERVEGLLNKYPDGLSIEAIERRISRRDKILSYFNATPTDWGDWQWQINHIIKDPETLNALAVLSEREKTCVEKTCSAKIPFGITPYYLGLWDDRLESGNDRALRAQVIFSEDLVKGLTKPQCSPQKSFDFMREADTSPIDLITRRYPAIVIFKPYNTCPQICAYCQRNWEIDQVMAPSALATPEKIESAINWIQQHPAIREVLVTGGDPLAMEDSQIQEILERLCKISHVDLIRIGTRTPVTFPMRFTDKLVTLIGSFREPGKREICLMTHIQHPYEVTPELVGAIDRVRRQGISVFNQLVFTFFVSRRFEAAKLRFLLRKIGVDPYYTFAPKGKEETNAYRVPLARLLQEQKEEARLLPGTRRSDEAVYNLPAIGKNYMRASQDRDLIGILPDGSRVYEFHPWEKQILDRDSYIGQDIPILDYLKSLADGGEDPMTYSGIWHYY